MMLPRNFETNRATAQSLSTGPTSDAGKNIVSQNSLKHGLTARKHACLPGEEEPFERHCREIREALAPVGAIEEALAHDIAGDRWRLTRARAMENALFAKFELDSSAPDRATAHAEAWIDASKGLQRIAGYARALQRAVERNSARLEAMQTVRKAARARASRRLSNSPNWQNPRAKPTTPRPISLRPEPPGSLFTQRPKSRVSSTAPAAWMKRKRAPPRQRRNQIRVFSLRLSVFTSKIFPRSSRDRSFDNRIYSPRHRGSRSGLGQAPCALPAARSPYPLTHMVKVLLHRRRRNRSLVMKWWITANAF